MTDNQKLIEDMRKRATTDSPVHELLRQGAHALEAAEKVHTPTDDALFDAIDRHLPMSDGEYCVCGATWGAAHLVAAITGNREEFGVFEPGAFRRSEVPEPSTPHCDGCAKYEHHHCYHCGKRAGLPHPTWCPNFDESAPEVTS